MWPRKQSGHDQHAAITNSYTTSITTSSPQFDLGACGSGRGLARAVLVCLSLDEWTQQKPPEPTRLGWTWVPVVLDLVWVVWEGGLRGGVNPRGSVRPWVPVVLDVLETMKTRGLWT